jgi:hypothetical protein
MQKIVLFFLLPMIIFLSACASQPAKTLIKNEETSDASEETAAVTVPSREAVFLYGRRQNLSSRLLLTLAGEPVLLPSGYIRLVGVVSGGKPTACLEIGGRGLALGEGEAVDDYRIVGIDGDSVVLEKR